MKKKQIKGRYCRHRDVVLMDMCPNCGVEVGWCEKCDDEVIREPSKKLLKRASF